MNNGVLRFVGNGRKRVEFSIIGETEINLNVSLEVFLYDSNDIVVGTYSPTHWNGKVEKLERGPFVIHDSFDLPDMLTSGEYSISIALSQMNIEHLARIEKAARIMVQGFSSPITGSVFYQSYSGSLILRNEDEQ